MKIRDRVKELRRVRASELRPHPANWRVHPPAQREALQGALAEVGFADALLAYVADADREEARKRSEGKLREWAARSGLTPDEQAHEEFFESALRDAPLTLINGHLRADTVPDQEVPVLVLDVTDEDAAKLLLSIDPLAARAGADAGRLAELLAEARTQSPALAQLWQDLAASLPGEDAPLPDEPAPEPPAPPAPRERFDVLVECRSEQEQAELLARLTAEGYACRSLIA